MPMGPVVKRFGRYAVTDDGEIGHKYSVRFKLDNDKFRFVSSGSTLNNATALAEAMHKTNAGTTASILTESVGIDT